ncbi:MAG TPA: MraY family glycosyltransferase, partial [Candidatus Gracilibacteria bacterium]
IPPLCLVGLVGFIDDREKLSIWVRMVAYLIAAFWVFAFGISIDFIGNPFAQTNIELEDYRYLSLILTVAWIFFIQQAMNWFDGLKGLCTGVSGVGFLTLGVLGLVRPELFYDPQHMTLTLGNLYLAGLVLGGFWYYWQGRIILGDTGSQALGFLLAVMSIWSGAKIMTTLLVLSLPLIDLGLVVLRRIFMDKKAPWKGDFRHTPHNLAKKYGEARASLILILISVLFGALAILLVGMTKLVVLAVVFLIVLMGGYRLIFSSKGSGPLVKLFLYENYICPRYPFSSLLAMGMGARSQKSFPEGGDSHHAAVLCAYVAPSYQSFYKGCRNPDQCHGGRYAHHRP